MANLSSTCLQSLLLWILLTTNISFVHVCARRLRILTITPGKTQQSTGGFYITPAFSVAMQDMAKRYPHLYANATFVPVDLPEDQAIGGICTSTSYGIGMNEFARAYAKEPNRNEVETVVLSSVCSPPYDTFGDFCREENVLAIACGSAVGDLTRLSTSVSVSRGTSFHEYAMPVAGLFAAFNWTRIALLVDLSSTSSSYSRMYGLRYYFKTHMQEAAPNIQLVTVSFDSTITVNPQPKALRLAANHSHIFLILALHKQLRELMVFILYYSVHVPTERPPEWYNGDNLDYKVRQAFEGSLLITTPPVNWTAALPITNRTVQRGVEIYNLSSDPENMYNEFVISCYESLDLLSQVLNESNPSINPINPSDFLRQLNGRTFQFELENITFDADRKRPFIFVLQTFDNTTGAFHTVSQFNYSSQNWFEDNPVTEVWSSGKTPLDRPVCGVTGDLCKSLTFVSSAGGIAMIVVILGITCATVVVSLAHGFARRYRMGLWWLLDAELLVYKKPKVKRAFSVRHDLWMPLLGSCVAVPRDCSTLHVEDARSVIGAYYGILVSYVQ